MSDDTSKKLRALEHMSKYKLYVWNKYCPDYSDGLAVVIATSVREALELLEAKREGTKDRFGPMKVLQLHASRVLSLCGGS